MNNPCHTPEEWQKITGIIIYDPDGWREDNKNWDDPIDQDEWNRRMIISTVIHHPKVLSETTCKIGA
jgi:hypothetical protein